ncbi:MAG: hypothetical protein J7L89_03390 [Bacteroidales bacterium]|nr:hypothetical protein [Bacteroidales bacterium]
MGSGSCDFILPNKPPHIEKTSPDNDAVFNIGASVKITLIVYDVDGSIKEVRLVVNGTQITADRDLPCEFTWNTAGLAEGEYKIEITAVDNKDNFQTIKFKLYLVNPLSAYAGEDVTLTTDATSYQLQADVPDYGTGTWSVISGTGGSFIDVHDPHTLFTGTSCQTYQLRWTVASGVSEISDDVTVRFFHTPSQANAGPDLIFNDGRSSATLQAVTPTSGTGHWSVVSGDHGTFDDASKPDALFTGDPCVTYQLRWEVSTACTSTTDVTEVRFNQDVLNAQAGPDQVFNDGTHTATMAANLPAGATGNWSIVSGTGGSFSDATDPHAVFTGQLCETYTLKWILTSSCGSDDDQVNISFNHDASVANAGTDIVLSRGTLSVTLNGNTPAQGDGVWMIVSGEGGELDDNTDPGCRFTGQPCQTYILRWTISTECDTKSDEVMVTLEDAPTTAYAGPDQKLINGTNFTHLQANNPQNGVGVWSVLSGVNYNFDDINDPATKFSGELCQTYVLRWTISTACASSVDEVEITFSDIIVPADAGPDQSFNDGTVTTRLEGNEPPTGITGVWTIIHGTGGALADPNSPTTSFTGILGQLYTLRWSVSSSCAQNFDEVYISFLQSGTLQDIRDSRTYQTIQIGDQVWMSENLNFPVTGSWAFENQASYPADYGRLYTYEAAAASCPDGWHLPTDDEWRTLEQFLGMDEATTSAEWYRGTDEGGKLKETGYSHWQGPNAGAMDIVFFHARPGGYRTPGGVFGGFGTHAGFWTATANDQSKAIYRALHKDKSQIGRDWAEEGYAWSVRCVKN